MNWNPFKREVKNISIGELDEFMLWKMNTRLGRTGDIGELRRRVPWLFRAIDTIAQKTADFPFEIQTLDGEVVDSSFDWKNALEFTKDFKRLLYKLSASLNLRGKGYIFPARNRIVTKALRYWVADTVTPIITETNGLEKFVRRVGNIKTEYAVTEDAPYPVCYFWLPDPDVEIGEPLAYPAQAALSAAGILSSLDDFFQSHVEDGMKKAILFAVKGQPPTGSEQGKSAKDKLEDDLSRTLLGKRNAGKIRVVNADTMTPVVYGEGLQEFANTSLTTDKEEDVAIALNMPLSYIKSSNASGLGGGGVSREDTFRLMADNIEPGFNFLSSIFNEQLFIRIGYKIVSKREMLDVFQEDKVLQATVAQTYTTAISTDARIAKFVMEYINGTEFDEEAEAALDELIAAKDERAAQMAELQRTQPQIVDVTPKPKQLTPGETPEQKRFRDDLMRWQRKVENRLRAGKAAQVEFESDIIDADTNAQVYAALAGARDADAVKVIFQGVRPGDMSMESPLETKFDAAMQEFEAAMNESAKGWVTINGAHILIGEEGGSGRHGDKVSLSNPEARGLMSQLANPDAPGFSYQTKTKGAPKSGYMLSIYPNNTSRLPIAKVNPKSLRAYAKANKKLLSKSDHYLGGWNVNGRVDLDVSINVKTPAEAHALSKKHSQEGYWDVEKMETVYVK